MENNENILKGWIARNKDGCLNYHQLKPEKYEHELLGIQVWTLLGGSYITFPLPSTWFKEVTYETGPKEVKMIVKYG